MADRNGYIGRAPSDSSVVVARQVFSPTGVQTTFTFASGYTVGYLDIYLNGARLISGQDFTATNGSTVGLTTYANGGDVLEAVAYKAFNIANPISDTTGNLTVGGNLTVSGSYSGDGSSLTGIVTGITAGDNISVSGSTGNVTITGLANTSNVIADTVSTGTLNVTGISTFAGQLSGAGASFTGNVSVGGTLTYEDVTNIDSVGLVTARSGIEVSGIVTARSGFAVTYYGDGSNLTGVVSGIEVEEAGSSVGTSLTAINFASGATVVGDATAGIATVTIAAGLNTAAVNPGVSTVITLNLGDAQDHKVTATGITTITVTGGTEGDSHTVRVVNSGVSTVGFSTYFLFPSGSSPSMPTGDEDISLISFTVHQQGSSGIATQLLAGASVNYS
jgi:hypothetical protein